MAETGATVETSQAGDQASVVQNEGSRTSGAAAQVRANGTVVLASPAQVKHVGIPSISHPIICFNLLFCFINLSLCIHIEVFSV